jgi:hypothetical protein
MCPPITRIFDTVGLASTIMTATISKTRFLAGRQCLKRLYFQIHQPELAAQPNGAAGAIIDQGREVGLLARRLFPRGIEVAGFRGLDQAISITKELVANPDVPAIFEGAFQYQGVIVKTDILVRRNDRWRLVEVKSTTSLKEHHIEDVAIQSYVVSHSGVNLGSASSTRLSLNSGFRMQLREPGMCVKKK